MASSYNQRVYRKGVSGLATHLKIGDVQISGLALAAAIGVVPT